jgi:RNA polymerase sigma factor (sigma-70 family)
MEFRILLEKINPALKAIARKHVLCGFYDVDDLYQEMCLYLWQRYGQGLPIGINESYVIKGCEFHLQNFLRKGRPKVTFSSLDELVTSSGETLGELLEDKKETFSLRIGDKLTIEEIKNIDLTEREKSTLSYLLKGYTIREIAQELGVSHVMVLKYKKGILKKWRKKR